MGKCILYINEQWKDIEGYEGQYQVSNCGRVKSLNHYRTGEEQMLKQTKTKKGYLMVQLRKDGKQKGFVVHRLVAHAFLPNPDNLPQVNHKDELKERNIVTNLEWCNNEYNSNYGTRTQRIVDKTTNGKCSKAVLQIDKETNEIIKEWPSINEVRRQLGLTHISDCCLGKRNICGEYKWKYA